MRSYPDLVNDVRAFLNRKDLDEQIPRFIALAEQDLFRRLRATCNETTVTYTPLTVGYPINAAVRLPDSAIELKTVLFNGIPLQYVSDAEYYRRLHRCPPAQAKIQTPEVGYPLPDDEPPAGFPIIEEEPAGFPIIPEPRGEGRLSIIEILPPDMPWPPDQGLLPPEAIIDSGLDRESYPPWLTPKFGHYLTGNGRPEVFTRIQNYLCFHPIAPAPKQDIVHVHMYRFDGPVDAANPNTSTLQDAYPAYLYGALSHAEGFLMNDPRIALWKSKFEETLQQLNGTKTDADMGSVMEVMSVYS
jgi:hypothetical protein